MNVNEWIEKAADYFGGNMAKEEIHLFETETAANPQLQNLMELWKQTETDASFYAQHEAGANDFIYTHKKLKPVFIEEQRNSSPFFLAETNEEIINPVSPIRKFRILPWLAAAAVITGIMFFASKIFSPDAINKNGIAKEQAQHKNNDSINDISPSAINKPVEQPLANTNNTIQEKKEINTAKLYAQNFVPDVAPEDQHGPMDDAFFYYEMKEYKKSIEAIENIPNKPLTRGSNYVSPQDSFYINYYKGLNYLCLGNAKAAIPALQQSILQKPFGEWLAKVQWYLALAYVKENKIEDAKKELNAITQNKEAGMYKIKASVLYKELNEY